MDMNIQKYKAFVTTVSCGSFTKAAEILNYSQSGISRMIHDLEKEWKVILLKRSKLGVRLTSSGMKLLPYAENVCKEYEKLQTEVDELQGLKSGLIRIGTFSSVATHWLAGRKSGLWFFKTSDACRTGHSLFGTGQTAGRTPGRTSAC